MKSHKMRWVMVIGLLIVLAIALPAFAGNGKGNTKKHHNFSNGKPFISLQQQITALQEQIASMQKQIAVIQSDIVYLNTHVTEIDGQINGMNDTIGTLVGSIIQINDNLAANQQEIANNNAAITALKTELSKSQEDLEQKINELNKLLEGKETALAAEIDSINNQIEVYESIIAQDRQNIATLGGKINALEKTVADLEARVGQDIADLYVLQEDLSLDVGELNRLLAEKEKSLLDQITLLRNQINLNSTMISQHQQDISSYGTQLAELSDLINGLQGNFDQNIADSVVIQSNINTLQAQINTLSLTNNTIQQEIDELWLTISTLNKGTNYDYGQYYWTIAPYGYHIVCSPGYVVDGISPSLYQVTFRCVKIK